MQILLNGTTREIRESITVKQLLTELGYELNTIAVAIDGSHLPRSSWEFSTVHQQNDIEIIAPMQGG